MCSACRSRNVKFLLIIVVFTNILLPFANVRKRVQNKLFALSYICILLKHLIKNNNIVTLMKSNFRPNFGPYNINFGNINVVKIGINYFFFCLRKYYWIDYMTLLYVEFRIGLILWLWMGLLWSDTWLSYPYTANSIENVSTNFTIIIYENCYIIT